MNVIAARLGLRGYDAGDCFAKLGVVVLQRNFGFGDCVEVGIHYDDPKDRILVIGSIQFECGAAEVLSLGEDLQAALRIFGGGVAPAHHLLRARRHQLQGREVAIQDGNILDVLVIEGGRDIGAVGLQLRSLRRSLPRFPSIRQPGIVRPRARRRRPRHECSLFKSLEPGAFGSDVINVGDKVGDAVVAVGIGRGFDRRTLCWPT